jgi:phosphatidate cytidylyltransferase
LKEGPIKSRILTAAIVLPLLVVFVLLAPRWAFFLLVCGVTGLALRELYDMSLPCGRHWESMLAIAAGVLLVVPIALEKYSVFLGGLMGIVFFFGCLFLWRFGTMERVAGELALLLFGFFYLTIPLGHLALLRDLPQGPRWILLVLLLVMSSDTAAYFSGTFCGRHKLYPPVSPNKSVEGAFGGLIGSLAAAWLAGTTFMSWVPMFQLLLLGLAAGVVAELGDLLESLLKRSFGVKDSGAIIPGHGGILDRLDSLLFAFPLTYYFALVLQG